MQSLCLDFHLSTNISPLFDVVDIEGSCPHFKWPITTWDGTLFTTHLCVGGHSSYMFDPNTPNKEVSLVSTPRPIQTFVDFFLKHKPIACTMQDA
jgi:hypothetical protein